MSSGAPGQHGYTQSSPQRVYSYDQGQQGQLQSQQQQGYYNNYSNNPPQGEDPYQQQQNGIVTPRAETATQDPITPLPQYSSPAPQMSKVEYPAAYQQQSQQQIDGSISVYTQGTVITSSASPPPQHQYLQPLTATANPTGTHNGVPTAQYISTAPGAVNARASMVYKPVVHTAEYFHYGMCGCFGDFFKCHREKMSTCCCGFWCPCVLYSRIHHRLRSEHPATIGPNEFRYCNGQCWAFMCIGSLGLSFSQRNEIRHKYKLNGTCCGDYCRHAWCNQCTMCQEEKEILYRERQLEQLVVANRYEANEGMNMTYVAQEKR